MQSSIRGKKTNQGLGIKLSIVATMLLLALGFGAVHTAQTSAATNSQHAAGVTLPDALVNWNN